MDRSIWGGGSVVEINCRTTNGVLLDAGALRL